MSPFTDLLIRGRHSEESSNRGHAQICGKYRSFQTQVFSQVVNNKVFPPNNGRDSMTVGDDRASIFVGLAALHTSFLRLHNTLDIGIMV